MIINKKQRSRKHDQKVGNQDTMTFEYLGSLLTNEEKIDAETANRGNISTEIYYILNKTMLGHEEIDTKVWMIIKQLQ